jgi:hypothetical protein
MRTASIRIPALFLNCFWLLLSTTVSAQDVEPRRWTAMPVGMNVVGAGYAYSAGDIAFDPVLQIEDATFDMQTLIASYSHSFGLFGRSARVDVLVPWQHGEWQGLLEGAPASVSRTGLDDPFLRMSFNLYGAPSLDAAEFRRRAIEQPANTIIGAAVSFGMPLGNYLEDKLLNLGQNRFIIRPQIGVLHTRGKWSFELTGSTYFLTENDEFWDGNTLKQEPIHALQGHVVYVFEPRLWASLSVAHGWRGETTINGVPKDNDKADVLTALSVGFPIALQQQIKLAYIRSETNRYTGANLATVAIAWSMIF